MYESPRPAAAADAPLAMLQGVHKHHGRVLALEGVDLALSAGSVLALLGPNGAGKSTAVALMLGLLAPDAGHAELLGLPPAQIAARRQAGAMLQSAALPETLTVGELLMQVRGYYPQPRSMADCVAMAGLEGLLGRRYGQLSGGQQRRVQFALAVCGRPRVLFLDEPTTGLDIEARQALWQAIATLSGEGCGVLLTTHYLEEAEALASQVAVLQAGRILARGSVEQIRARVLRRRILVRTCIAAAQIARWPGVAEVDQRDGVTHVLAEPAEPVVARLLAEDPQLGGLEVQRAGLADAFLEITRAQEAA